MTDYIPLELDALALWRLMRPPSLCDLLDRVRRKP